jgi:hypothetical protein
MNNNFLSGGGRYKIKPSERCCSANATGEILRMKEIISLA